MAYPGKKPFNFISNSNIHSIIALYNHIPSLTSRTLFYFELGVGVGVGGCVCVCVGGGGCHL